ncbi:lytic transglycosylase domain-containing protein [Arvimicrobium flavum]|uniref:lytic transglycosylase domain-containing protein n=1 Tax=Arvimicrobium flavum TaxID=3393320 RepID=UPI00237A918E|nr:lytic transglycosylase domain-containing protein [Mesorhizobium shangrilense]
MSVQWCSRLVLIAALSLLVPAGTPAVSGASKVPGAAKVATFPGTPPSTEKTGRLDIITTASIPRAPAFMEDAGAVSMAELKRGLDALAVGDVRTAWTAREALIEGSLDHHIMTWAIAIGGGLASHEIAGAARALHDWPGVDMLRRNGERALFRENPPPNVVLETLGSMPPQTAEGARALARAHLALDDRTAAQKVIGPFWRTEKLEARDEAAILKEFGELLTKSDHRFRMERMLYAERIRSAERVAPRAGAEQLQKAWAAVLRGEKGAAKLLAAVPADQRSAGFYFAEARLLRRAEQFAKAAAAMAKAPKDGESLVDPDAWWIERRVLSRELMDIGDVKGAYGVAASHSAQNPSNAVDAEFHAGWYALRGLNEPVKAARHFARIAEIADGPISSSRAYYWMGRAAEAGAPGDAKTYYRKAAGYGTAFYGQLAAQRIGLSIINVPNPEPSASDLRSFARRESVQAIARLEAAGHAGLADRLYRDLAVQLTSAGEMALLTAKAEKRGNHFFSLRLAKAAARRGIDIGGLAHPVGVIPPSADIKDAGKALAYAIARQESEFNIGAVSKAGALGLLQLLPGTAKDMAERNGLPFSKARLTTDAGYNATLGAAFLGEQLERFDGSYILTFAGYNAGPSRASQWIKRYGDPRGKDIDTVVDWIERIPFTETRGYVQRVMENYQVYKMRLTGQFNIVGDLVHGRQ